MSRKPSRCPPNHSPSGSRGRNGKSSSKSAIERERFRSAAGLAGGGAEAGDVDLDSFGIEPHRLSDRPARRQRVLPERAAQPRELLAKRAVRLFASARPNELGETIARQREPFGKAEAGENRHRLPTRKRDAPAVDPAQLERAKQTQLHYQGRKSPRAKDSNTRLKPRVNSPSNERWTCPPAESDVF
jgi:hypothetical protein